MTAVVLGPPIAQSMVSFAWAWMAVGIAIGACLGMFAFEGPLPEPRVLTDYSSCNRRLLRLGHVAFIMLPLISMSYAEHIGATTLSPSTQVSAVVLCWIGMVGVPLVCVVSAFYRPIKYAFPVPVASFLVCLVMMAVGKW